MPAAPSAPTDSSLECGAVTRQTRILIALGVIAAAGVGGLVVVANQYKKRLGEPPAVASAGAPTSDDAAARAARFVDGFIAGRRAAQGVIERYPVKIKQLTAIVTKDFSEVQGQRMGSNIDAAGAYRVERYNAVTAHGMTSEDYATVRTAWRAWKDGKPVDDRALAAALEAKRQELETVSLGPNEPFDDVIK